MPTIDLTPILQALIGLLAPLITARLIPWIRARTTESQRATLTAAVRVAVCAAEQLYGAGKGEQKLNYALTWLREHGYDVQRSEIEAAVYTYINSGALVAIGESDAATEVPAPTPHPPGDTSDPDALTDPDD